MLISHSFAVVDRPAALRRGHSSSSVHQLGPSLSPAPNGDVNWLGATSPWSTTTERESRYDSSSVKGTIMPRSEWKVRLVSCRRFPHRIDRVSHLLTETLFIFSPTMERLLVQRTSVQQGLAS